MGNDEGTKQKRCEILSAMYNHIIIAFCFDSRFFHLFNLFILWFLMYICMTRLHVFIDVSMYKRNSIKLIDMLHIVKKIAFLMTVFRTQLNCG